MVTNLNYRTQETTYVNEKQYFLAFAKYAIKHKVDY